MTAYSELIKIAKKTVLEPGDEARFQEILQEAQTGLSSRFFNINKSSSVVLSQSKCVIDEDYFTPLSLCAKRGHDGLVTLLLDACAEVNAAGKATPLMEAVDNGKTSTVALLLSAGADFRIKHSFDNLMKTPLAVACDEGYARIATLLLDAGADPFSNNVITHSGTEYTALYVAVYSGHLGAVTAIAQSNLATIEKLELGLTVAIGRQQCVIAQYLVSQGVKPSEEQRAYAAANFITLYDPMEALRGELTGANESLKTELAEVNSEVSQLRSTTEVLVGYMLMQQFMLTQLSLSMAARESEGVLIELGPEQVSQNQVQSSAIYMMLHPVFSEDLLVLDAPDTVMAQSEQSAPLEWEYHLVCLFSPCNPNNECAGFPMSDYDNPREDAAVILGLISRYVDALDESFLLGQPATPTFRK